MRDELNLAGDVPAMQQISRISRVELSAFSYEVPNASRDDSTGKVLWKRNKRAQMPGFAVKLFAANGVTGEYVAHMGGRPAVLAQCKSVARALLGTPVGIATKFGESAKKHLQTLGGLGYGPLEIASWDLLGKTLGVSVGTLIGQQRDRLPAYASLVHGHPDGDLRTCADLVDAVLAARQAGFTGVKFRGWPGRGAASYREAIQAVAKALPDRDETALFLDPGCDLATFAEALHVGRAADEAGLLWLEDMLRDTGQSLAAQKRLRERIRTPLLSGEHVRGLEAKAEWVASGATDFIRADPELDGGITGCLKIAHLAEAFGMDVEIHGSGPAHRHVMAAIRNTNFYEMGLALPDGTNIHAPPVYGCGYSDNFDGLKADGCATIPDGPGIGVVYNWNRLQPATTETMVFQE